MAALVEASEGKQATELMSRLGPREHLSHLCGKATSGGLNKGGSDHCNDTQCQANGLMVENLQVAAARRLVRW